MWGFVFCGVDGGGWRWVGGSCVPWGKSGVVSCGWIDLPPKIVGETSSLSRLALPFFDFPPSRLRPPCSDFAPPPSPPPRRRWLEDAITEWQTSQGHLVAADNAGYSPRQVEEVKLVLRLLPVFFTTVLYWTIYCQMGSMFVQQGSLMDERVRGCGVSPRVGRCHDNLRLYEIMRGVRNCEGRLQTRAWWLGWGVMGTGRVGLGRG